MKEGQESIGFTTDDFKIVTRALLYLAHYHASQKASVWEKELVPVLATPLDDFLSDLYSYYQRKKGAEPSCTPDVLFERDIINPNEGMFVESETLMQALVLLAVKLDNAEVTKDDISRFDLFATASESLDETLQKVHGYSAGNVTTISISELLALSRDGVEHITHYGGGQSVTEFTKKKRVVH